MPSGARRVVNFLSQTLAKLGTPRACIGESRVQSRYGANGVGSRVMRFFLAEISFGFTGLQKIMKKKVQTLRQNELIKCASRIRADVLIRLRW